MIVPIVLDGEQWISHTWNDRSRTRRFAAHEEMIDSVGLCAYRTTAEREALAEDRAAVDAVFHRLVRERLEFWLTVM